MNGISAIAIFAIVMMSLTVLYTKKNGVFRIGSILLFLYTISAICSIIFYQAYSIGFGYNNITLWPYVYWLAVYLLMMRPVFAFDRLNVDSIYVNLRFIKLFGIFLFIISILPLIEVVLHANNLMQGNINDTFIDIHDENKKASIYSPLAQFCFRVINNLQLLAFTLLIPTLRAKVPIFSKIGIVMALLVCTLTGLSYSSRTGLFISIIILVLVYAIFVRTINKKLRTKIRIVGLFLLVFILCVFMIITIGRGVGYQERNSDMSVAYFMARYAGEGYLNFNQYIFNVANTADGDICIPVFKQILGLPVIETSRDTLYGHFAYLTNIPQMIFYTFEGSWLMDFGPFISFIIFALLSSAYCLKINKLGQSVCASDVFLFVCYLKIMAFGVISYAYGGSASRQIIYFIMIYLVLKKFKM